MATKRSRLARSSSSANTSVITGAIAEPEIRFPVSRPPLRSSTNDSPVGVLRNAPENGSPVVFSISVFDCEPVDRRWGELRESFLEKCFYCKKRLEECEEVFMYSNLRAFCTAECRTKQIDMDEDLKALSATPRVKSGKRRS